MNGKKTTCLATNQSFQTAHYRSSCSPTDRKVHTGREHLAYAPARQSCITNTYFFRFFWVFDWHRPRNSAVTIRHCSLLRWWGMDLYIMSRTRQGTSTMMEREQQSLTNNKSTHNMSHNSVHRAAREPQHKQMQIPNDDSFSGELYCVDSGI